MIGDHNSDYDETANTALEESWIVTQDSPLKAAAKQAVRNKGYGRRQRQPKGTKPRRWKGNKNNATSAKKVEGIKSVRTSLEDDESTSSSIAIVPSPEPLARPATIPVAASTVLAASSDAKQMAAIYSARAVRSNSYLTLMALTK